MRVTKPLHTLLFGLMLGLVHSAAAADVVVIVSSRSALTELSKYQLADIFLGRTNRLSSGAEVIPVNQTEGSPVRDAFYLEFTGRSPAQVKAHWSKLIFTGRGKPPMDVADGDALKKLISGDPHAIGYLDLKALDESVRALVVK